QLPGLPLAQLPDRWYRYYANIGTFRVHRWLHDGADRKRIAEVKQARAEIAKAIAIKPNAHFGRETYQLQVMDWIIADGKVKNDTSRTELGDHLSKVNDRPITEGLAGLVVLGNAWESMDVFTALGRKLVREESGVLGYLAALRATELARKGKKSLFSPLNPNDSRDATQRIEDEIRVQIPSKEWLPAKYGELRAEAEVWQQSRTRFMMRRLNAGRHPDTDPHFWNGYSPNSAPSLSTGAFAEWRDRTFTATNLFLMVFYTLFGSATFVIMRALVGWWRNRV
ncbi:MAG: hypothetical protein H7145_16620, partial [Akkermansiaceae bacterium]|nr:hypothetical protein [Armatimonadota bacterium]